MKKTLCVLMAAGFLAAAFSPALAGGRGGYYGHPGYYRHSGVGIGGFFAGLVGGAILGTIIANSQPAPVYAAPPPPPPPAYVPPARVWVPGRYETRYRQEWVPGYWAEGARGHGENWSDY